mgnify:CR=1 FL=1
MVQPAFPGYPDVTIRRVFVLPAQHHLLSTMEDVSSLDAIKWISTDVYPVEFHSNQKTNSHAGYQTASPLLPLQTVAKSVAKVIHPYPQEHAQGIF